MIDINFKEELDKMGQDKWLEFCLLAMLEENETLNRESGLTSPGSQNLKENKCLIGL